MKKFLVCTAIIFVFGYVLIQNGPLLFLRILSFGSGSTQNTSSNAGSSSPMPPYKDGTFNGSTADAYYGYIQVQATISSGKITDVQFLQYPSDRSRSVAINTVAMPNLKQEAIQAQSANVDIVSGATDSSQAFIQSLSSALSQAK